MNLKIMKFFVEIIGDKYHDTSGNWKFIQGDK